MQKYTEAESRTNKFVLPRRRQYFCRRQIYAEAESNANEFALACFEQRSREASGSRIRRAKQACKPGGLHCRGVNRISARQGKYRRSREGHGVPRNEGTGARFVPGGGGKCYGFTANEVHFPGKDWRGMLAEWLIMPMTRFVPGKVLRFCGISVHFPPKEDKCTPVGSV